MYSNAFRLNIRAFLAGPWSRRVPIAGVHKASAYIVQLKSSQGNTLLHVYEERLNDKDGGVCDQCRCMGEQQGLLGVSGISHNTTSNDQHVQHTTAALHGAQQAGGPCWYCCAATAPAQAAGSPHVLLLHLISAKDLVAT